VANFLRVGVETVKYGKGICKKKKTKQRGAAHKVQLKRKSKFLTVSIIIGAHIECDTNFNSLA
jgi:hypothetical protein